MRRILLTSFGLALASSVAATETADISLTLLQPTVDAVLVAEDCARCLGVDIGEPGDGYAECADSAAAASICWEIHDRGLGIDTCGTVDLIPGQECEGSPRLEDEDGLADVTDAEVIYAPEGMIVGTIVPCSTSNRTDQS